jgi:hypothetical protein
VYKIKGWRDGEVVFHAGAMDAIGVCNLCKVAMDDGTSTMVEVWDIRTDTRVQAYVRHDRHWVITSPAILIKNT